jgi:RNA polymerase sigma-70 factor (ECF subfamily)
MKQTRQSRWGTPQTDFEKLLEQCRSDLHRHALRLTGEEEDAADLMQETVVRAFSRFHQFQPGTNFRAWMHRILHNQWISEYRHQNRSVPTVPLDEVMMDIIPDPTPDHAIRPEAVVMGKIRDEEVETALAELNPDFRRVVELCDLQGYDYREISDTLQIPIGTVRSRLSRGRKFLRERLTNYALERGLVKPHEVEAALS